ncbi:hypothetical protein SRB5_67830 [Streptomyces sp. RB5]|uniref:Uncharacterized protein n=1 Tax=Streptomyces smaragdinus TaxID=2585196 RepID=A0A7K0CUD8_9ACTN|nr:hypothetical protein [Streptomyces smaragdinus]MQY16582.1 hypothetical protein [Streptomyces smaragdinus]
MVTASPPRPISPGDIVAVLSDDLGEWTAAQITAVDPQARTADVLELEWSGPEPGTPADLGDIRPLRLTHHSWRGGLAHSVHSWVLPRGFKVLGTLPVLTAERANGYTPVWNRGYQLARQRLWDSGSRETWTDPHRVECPAADLALDDPRPDIRTLWVSAVGELDCARLATCYPNLTTLGLIGELGTLSDAVRLNDLSRLRSITLSGVFGMDATDVLVPDHVPDLENLRLHNIPADYATATGELWTPEARQGVDVDIHSPRTPDWMTANLKNPLRDWDGRDHISRKAYRRSTAQYEKTRRDLTKALAEGADPDRIFAIGAAYGEGFNKIDLKEGVIETVEREELYDVLAKTAREAGATEETVDRLTEGLDSTRDW